MRKSCKWVRAWRRIIRANLSFCTTSDATHYCILLTFKLNWRQCDEVQKTVITASPQKEKHVSRRCLMQPFLVTPPPPRTHYFSFGSIRCVVATRITGSAVLCYDVTGGCLAKQRHFMNCFGVTTNYCIGSVSGLNWWPLAFAQYRCQVCNCTTK